MTINEFFPLVLLTNMPSRTDRLAQATRQLDREGIGFKVRPGIKWTGLVQPHLHPINYGTSLAFRARILEAKSRNVDSVLIFEDDVVMAPYARLVFDDFVAEIPEDWELFYLGWRWDCPLGIEGDVNASVLNLKAMWCCHAVAIRKTVYDILLAATKFTMVPIDFLTHTLCQRGKAYCFSENLAWQRKESATEHDQYSEESHNLAPMIDWKAWLRTVPGWEFVK